MASTSSGAIPGPIASTPSGSATSPALGSATSSALAAGDEPLPATYGVVSSDDLREAVGAKPARGKRARTPPPVSDDDDDDDLGDKPRSRKTVMVVVGSLVVGLGIVGVVFLGRANSGNYYVSCETDRIVAERGRAFPPWGETELDGKPWAAIKIPPDAECAAFETDDEAKLSTEFRRLLVQRASVLLTAKEVTKVDDANALLEQALLHTRADNDESRNARAEIKRLLGDVVYWRASLKLRDASAALLEAAKQFDAAAQQQPRHVTDAAVWADYVRKVVGELQAGPSGSTQVAFPPVPPSAPGDQRLPAPPGVALPVEPDKGSAGEAPPPPTPDAGVPTGGVLL